MSEKELEAVYKKFMVMGDSKATKMNSRNFVKCLKDSKVLGAKESSNSADIIFSKVKAKTEKTIDFRQFMQALEKVAEEKKVPKEDIFARVAGSSGPVMSGVTKTSKTGGVEKMTDTSQYTGSHKERFGADGKGKGLDGRVDQVDGSGYVGNYKGAGSYEEKVSK
uniref:Tubulin polymerization-promoting protein family member 3 n=1 Tax=Ciona savignyi TaxID=51511 RepID=H2Z4T4_CIOSA